VAKSKKLIAMVRQINLPRKAAEKDAVELDRLAMTKEDFR
jgi:hypothetical protein